MKCYVRVAREEGHGRKARRKKKRKQKGKKGGRLFLIKMIADITAKLSQL